MKKYVRLQHSRRHSCPQEVSVFFNGAQSSAPASAKGMPDDKGGGNIDGYRLSAAVQRAMAMRERGSPCKAEDIKGIGGMRDIYMSGFNHPSPLSSDTEMAEEEIFHAAIGPQSVKYSRFCPDLDGDNQEFGRLSNGEQKLEMFGVYSCVPDLGGNQGLKKKNFVKRLCRQLFGRRKKSSAMREEFCEELH